MSPSILQLTALGIQDTYLTHNPEINIFKYKYHRYVNFASEIVKINPNEAGAFGKKFSIDIPKKGHLLSRMHLHVKLPRLEIESGEYACWADTLAYSILEEPIELEIGGQIVERLYPTLLDIKNELTVSTKKEGVNSMLLKGDTFVSSKYNAIKEHDLVIPLDFWFSKEPSLALPLLSLYNQSIKINIKFRNFDKCINFDGETPPQFAGIINTELFAEYIFLDDIIVDKFQRQTHQYIIDMGQYDGGETISSGLTTYNSNLKFNHPVRELLLCCVSRENLETNNYFVYNDDNENPFITDIGLQLDGKERFQLIPEFYYRQVFPEQVHSVVPLKCIYNIPFSLRPEKNQPSGSINLGQFNDVVLNLKLREGNPELFLYVYAVSHNVVTIKDGLLRMEFVV